MDVVNKRVEELEEALKQTQAKLDEERQKAGALGPAMWPRGLQGCRIVTAQAVFMCFSLRDGCVCATRLAGTHVGADG